MYAKRAATSISIYFGAVSISAARTSNAKSFPKNFILSKRAFSCGNSVATWIVWDKKDYKIGFKVFKRRWHATRKNTQIIKC